MTNVTVRPRPARPSAALVPPTAPSAIDLRTRVCEAAVVCVASQGLRATTVDDVAAAAGCGRATIYRLIPGGRAGLFAATIDHGIAVVLAACERSVADATSLADAVARAVNAAATALAGFDAFQRVLVEEPGAVLPFISFERLAPLLDRASAWAERAFAPFADAPIASVAGDWAARVVLDHLRTPGSPIDLTDPDHCHRLVTTFFIPAVPN